jgi:hypothetical protein
MEYDARSDNTVHGYYEPMAGEEATRYVLLGPSVHVIAPKEWAYVVRRPHKAGYSSRKLEAACMTSQYLLET